METDQGAASGAERRAHGERPEGEQGRAHGERSEASRDREESCRQRAAIAVAERGGRERWSIVNSPNFSLREFENVLTDSSDDRSTIMAVARPPPEVMFCVTRAAAASHRLVDRQPCEPKLESTRVGVY